MDNVNIKVKFHKISMSAMMNSGFEFKDPAVTFIAYSDRMKANVLHTIAMSPESVKVSVYTGPARDGEWLEEWYN